MFFFKNRCNKETNRKFFFLQGCLGSTKDQARTQPTTKQEQKNEDVELRQETIINQPTCKTTTTFAEKKTRDRLGRKIKAMPTQSP